MPKIIPEEIKARIVELLRAGKSATVIIGAIRVEFEGFAVSKPTIVRMAPRSGVTMARGRPVGVTEDQLRAGVDPELRYMAEAALGETGSLRKAGTLLGISHTRIMQLLSDDK